MKTTLILILVSCAASAWAATNTQNVNYFYDDAGRLAASYVVRGTTNMAELFACDANGNRTNRTVYGLAAAGGDLDGDGLSDLWELSHFVGLVQPAGGDPDLDGSPNRDEERAGTDPRDAVSVFEISGSGAPGSGALGPVIRWSSVAGKQYGLARATNLMTAFSNLRTNIPATPPLNVHTDASASGVGPWIYRVELE